MRTTTTFALFITVMVAVPAAAQDRGVSIPDVFTPHPGDAFVTQEVTSALRIAAGMMPEWRLSTVDVPLSELMRACGGSLEVDPDLGCMARMITTRDPSMTGGLVIFAFMERVGEANGFRIAIALYDMSTNALARQIGATVERIMAPAARNRLAAGWIRELIAPPVEGIAQVGTPEPEASESGETPSMAVDAEPEAPITRVPVDPPRVASDFTGVDVASGLLLAAGIASAIAASITGGLVLSMNDDARYQAYRGAWHPNRYPDVCVAAASDPSPDGRYAAGVCSDASALEIATHVLWAVAGFASVTGAFVFLLPRALSSEPSVEVAPVITPTQAGLALRASF